MTQITLLDGGMGQELTHRATKAPTPLWGTQVMLDQPGSVQAVHLDYFRAGATVATTNSYAIHHDRLVPAGMDDRFDELHGLAMSEALAARAAYGRGRIAGSVGPIGATYRPEVHPDHDEAVSIYSEFARHLTDCDLILCESVASVRHARSVLQGAAVAGLPVWLSVTVDDHDGTRLRSGEPVADIVPVLGDAQALLVNCSSPEAIRQTMPVLAQSGLPFGGYANGFRQITSDFLKDQSTVASLTSRDLSPEAYADHAMAWIDAGATIVGGCCEVGPAHIETLARRIRAAGHTIV